MPIRINVKSEAWAVRQQDVVRRPRTAELIEISLSATNTAAGAVPVTLKIKISDAVWALVPGSDDDAKSQAVSTALSEWLAQNTPQPDDILGLRLELERGGPLNGPIRVERPWRPN